MANDDTFNPETGTVVEIEENLDDIPPQHSVPGGEWQLKLVKVKLGESKETHNPYTMPSFEIVDDPDSKIINHVIMKALPSDPERTRRARLRALGDFHRCFEIPPVGRVNYDEYIGNLGYALLSEENDPQYGMQNRIVRFVVPQS